MPVHDFDPPDRFVVGTVGPPGQRTFFLQVSGGRRLISCSCEKQQISVLADRVSDLLDQFSVSTPPTSAGPDDLDPLATPIEDEFRVATLSLAWDPTRAVVVIEVFDSDVPEPGPEDEAAPDMPDSFADAMDARTAVRVVLTPDQARAFAKRAQSLVTAGRPPCPFCGGPLDPTGHVCPRSNGYRR
ncbi:MAG: DUF3090 domain-containing protein [Lapillicoccus sp.]